MNGFRLAAAAAHRIEKAVTVTETRGNEYELEATFEQSVQAALLLLVYARDDYRISNTAHSQEFGRLQSQLGSLIRFSVRVPEQYDVQETRAWFHDNSALIMHISFGYMSGLRDYTVRRLIEQTSRPLRANWPDQFILHAAGGLTRMAIYFDHLCRVLSQSGVNVPGSRALASSSALGHIHGDSAIQKSTPEFYALLKRLRDIDSSDERLANIARNFYWTVLQHKADGGHGGFALAAGRSELYAELYACALESYIKVTKSYLECLRTMPVHELRAITSDEFWSRYSDGSDDEDCRDHWLYNARFDHLNESAQYFYWTLMELRNVESKACPENLGEKFKESL